MIKFPEIDLKSINIRVIIFILSIFLFFLNNFETKTLISILVLIVVINQYSTIKDNIKTKIINDKEKPPLLLNYIKKRVPITISMECIIGLSS